MYINTRHHYSDTSCTEVWDRQRQYCYTTKNFYNDHYTLSLTISRPRQL